MTVLQVPSCQTFFKINFKLGMDLSPVLPVTGPFFRDVHGCQIQHFQKAVIRRKNRLAFGHFPELAVESFNGICGIKRETRNITYSQYTSPDQILRSYAP